MTSRRADLAIAIRLSLATIVWNGVAGGTAVLVALASGSLSLLGFGFDAAVDSVASIALVWRFAAEHGQPHRADRVERVASAVVGGVLVVLGVYVAIAAVHALVEHQTHAASAPAIALLVASAVVLPPLAIAKRRVAQRLDSRALRGDSILTLVAGLLAVVGLVSVILAEVLGFWWADAVGALVISTVLLREGAAGLLELREQVATERQQKPG
jgi:divalent metal cation (Fe/Co/Zn/Cd) transporter